MARFWVLQIGTNSWTGLAGIAAFGPTSIIADTSTPILSGLLSVSGTTQAIATRGFGIERADATVRLSDHGGDVKAILQAQNIRGEYARLAVGETGVAPDDWYIAFSGIVSSWNLAEPYAWEVRLTTNDVPLLKDAPRTEISSYVFPNALARDYGRLVPAVFGVNDSRSTTGQGAYYCPCIDQTAGWYAAGALAIKSVDRVYIDGVQQPATVWSYGYKRVGGRLFTCIEFDSTATGYISPLERDVTCDAQGMTADAEGGTGAVLTHPVDQIDSFLTNFVFAPATGKGSTTRPTRTPGIELDVVSTGSLSGAASYYDHASAKTFLGSAIKTSRVLDKPDRSAQAILEEWCQSVGVRAFWETNGSIGFAPLDHTLMSLPTDQYWVPQHEQVGSLSTACDVADVTDSVAVTFMRVGDGLRDRLVVQDLSVDNGVELSVQIEWSRTESD